MGKIKVPNNGERIIVVDGGHREGCFLQTLNVGCALIFAIIGLLILGSCWTMHKVAESRSEMPPQTLQERTETPTRPNTRPTTSNRVEVPSRVSHDDSTRQIETPTAAPEPTVKIATCEKCKGKGVVAVQSNCSKCGGAGRIYVNGKWTPCPKTVTTGKRKCRDCDGTGTIEIRE